MAMGSTLRPSTVRVTAPERATSCRLPRAVTMLPGGHGQGRPVAASINASGSRTVAEEGAVTTRRGSRPSRRKSASGCPHRDAGRKMTTAAAAVRTARSAPARPPPWAQRRGITRAIAPVASGQRCRRRWRPLRLPLSPEPPSASRPAAVRHRSQATSWAYRPSP